METLSIDDVDHSPHPRIDVSVRRLLGAELGAERVDVTYYEIEPGGRFAGAYHRHLEREEVFVVLSGEATFRTEAGRIPAARGEAICFAPGDWQLGSNDGSEPVTALLIGTPTELAPVEAYLECPECDAETRFLVEPETQQSGESMDESRRCTRCGESFDR